MRVKEYLLSLFLKKQASRRGMEMQRIYCWLMASWMGGRVKERNDREIECYISTDDITLTY